jgi:hypothetical protein
VNVGEFAHAGGEVDRGTAVGDFDLAPGSMHIEEDKQVGGSVSPILAVVALDLAWVGRMAERLRCLRCGCRDLSVMFRPSKTHKFTAAAV